MIEGGCFVGTRNKQGKNERGGGGFGLFWKQVSLRNRGWEGGTDRMRLDVLQCTLARDEDRIQRD